MERRLPLTSVSWIVQIAVARDAERRAARHAKAPEERIQPGTDHRLQKREPELAVWIGGQTHEPVEHRGDLEHGV